ncbi:hypothetical protein [Haliangium sp.]|uniref:hypothetical protein n=1 Tax=Haliangium sp. TaxID=2663208 RepID=UPI003D09B2FB
MQQAWLSLVLIVLVVACAPSGAPADTIKRFYTAVAAGDCEAARAELARAYQDDLERAGVSCATLLEEMQRYPLAAVDETKVDGRNPDAHLVQTRLVGRREVVIIRVQAEDGRWKIFAM